MATKTGYVNGSDVLLYANDVAIGHCTSHTATFSSETKDRAVKPVASETLAAGLWKDKSVTGLSYSVKAEGLRFYDETESGYKTLLALWKEGGTVTIKLMERAASDDETVSPYLEGECVITNLESETPAQDDATYSVDFENSGAPTIFDASVITGE